jgi:hypothetical protein
MVDTPITVVAYTANGNDTSLSAGSQAYTVFFQSAHGNIKTIPNNVKTGADANAWQPAL